MKLIIDIDEDTYKYMQSRCKYQNKGDKGLSKFEEAGVAIKNGTPLPKGHGDIVDIETLIDMFWDGNSMEITKYDLSVIKPIIEADKAESEE